MNPFFDIFIEIEALEGLRDGNVQTEMLSMRLTGWCPDDPAGIQ
jgi:hypothetical protein